jgi:hypothetical protein
MPSVIDKLPEADRKKVIDALLAQKPLRDIAKAAGCSHTAVQNYRDRVLRPALETARKVNAITAVANSPIDAESDAQRLTRARLATDPFVERVQVLENERARVKGLAEAAGDLRTWAALDRNDITALELHARLERRLDGGAPTGTTTIAFITLPGGNAGVGQALDEAAIDTTAVEIDS